MLSKIRETIAAERLPDFDALMLEAARESSFGELKSSDLRQALRLALDTKMKSESTPKVSYSYGYVIEVFQSFIVTNESFYDESNDYQSGNFKRDYSVSGTTITVGDRGIAVELSWVPVLKGEMPTAVSDYMDGCGYGCEAEKAETPADLVRATERGKPTPAALACQSAEMHVSESSGNLADAKFSTTDRVIEGIVPIVSGMSKNRKYYPASVLQRDVAVFNGQPVFYDHQDPDQPKPLKNIIGVLENSRWDAAAGVPRADLRYTKSSEAQIEDIRDKWTLLGGDRVGFSIDMTVKAKVSNVEGVVAQSVEALIGGYDASTDVVFNPAAGGTFDKALEAVAPVCKELSTMTPEQLAALQAMSLEDLRAARPDLIPAQEAVVETAVATEVVAPAATPEVVSREAISEMVRAESGRLINETTFRTQVAGAKVSDRVREAILREAQAANWEPSKTSDILAGWLNDAAAANGGVQVQIPGASLRVTESQDVRYARLLGAARKQDQIVDGKTVKRFMRLSEAIFAFHPELMGMAHHNPSEFARECINKMHWGGGELGSVMESKAREAVISSTFSLSWADVMHKVLLAEIADPDLNTWRMIVSEIVPFSDLLRTHKTYQLGDYAEIATVNEGAAYQYMTTPGEQKVEFGISKYGNLEKYTWESALADDLGILARIPAKLGKAWAWTVYDFVYSLLTTNSGDGVTMDYDSVTLYNSGRSNNTNTAFTMTDLVASEGKMRDQTDISQTTHRKMFRAKYLLYASESSLRQAIWETLFSNFKVNPLSTSGSQVNLPSYVKEYLGLEPIEVMYPDASTTRWELVADPRQVATIQMGFLHGNDAPELFVQDMDRVGSVFNNDQITYKLRGTMGGDVIDHRAFSRGRK